MKMKIMRNGMVDEAMTDKILRFPSILDDMDMTIKEMKTMYVSGLYKDPDVSTELQNAISEYEKEYQEKLILSKAVFLEMFRFGYRILI